MRPFLIKKKNNLNKKERVFLIPIIEFNIVVSVIEDDYIKCLKKIFYFNRIKDEN